MIELEDLQQQLLTLQLEASLLYVKNSKATELIEQTIKLYSAIKQPISTDDFIDMLLDLRDLLKG